MHIHLKIHRWVLGWISVGVVLGAVAVLNILAHHLTPTEDRVLIMLGVAHWLLGGMICWAFEGVKVETPPANEPPVEKVLNPTQHTEYHSPSDFLLPGNKQSILPWRH
jgi:hypothetical protein